MSPRARLIAATALGFALASSGAALADPSGQELFQQNCSACHQVTGKGIPGAFPALDGDPFVVQPDPAIVAYTVLHGRGGMPTFAPELTDEQISTILTYVRSAWSNKAGPVTAALVKSQRTSGAPPKPHIPEQAH
jgi:mono/diheme cytochrome c family protein